MPRHLEGNLIATGLRLAIITSRWNHFIGDRLVEGALDAIKRHGGDPDAADLVFVPGAFEIPIAAQKLAKSGKYDAVICLGTLIRGATPHFDYIAAEATKGVAAASMDTGVPLSYGIITADSLDQAIERAGTKAGNKGHEAALAAIEMANLFKQI
ncbi:MAG: 6,7-dimethyl-8-ribityllumazine synthase [Myxococcales bacterium]|jgi:6,7-dimethyl-8-ribityllumazine synthase|nr:6,7-dimethyl-8-ribityllumazine synthase [Myxococcales bacterium]